ncbi:hypothetical protein [Rathayibacter sp. PhB152]|uniref:hypothetical protein n=1 Tax=Rathayibacter sp. PhB152 TaxID=2485190 RepID=UPI0011CE387D|nr:hypothetical protein [Rathayibacter sp. PhB152]
MLLTRLSSLVPLRGACPTQLGSTSHPSGRRGRFLSRLDDEEIAAVVRQRVGMESESLADVAARFGVVLDEV